MKKKILSLCMVVALAAMQAPAFVQAADVADGAVIWEETFEDKAVGANVMEDTEHWAKSERRGGNNGNYDYSAVIAGNDGHKYLKISASSSGAEWADSGSPTMGVASKPVTSMGLEAGDVFTVSYDFKMNDYDSDKMNAFEYYQSISRAYPDGGNIGNLTKDVYFYSQAKSGNETAMLTHTSQGTTLDNIFGTDARELPNTSLYTNGWNSLQWVVYPATTLHHGYAEMYLNGVYVGTITNRQGTESPVSLVVAIAPKSANDKETAIYLDNIKVVKGAANGTAMADTTNTVVNAVSLGFDDCDLSAKKLGIAQNTTVGYTNKYTDGNKENTTAVSMETSVAEFDSDINNTALKLCNAQETTKRTVSSNLDMYLTATPATKLYADGDKQEISFNFAFDGVTNEFQIKAGRIWSSTYDGNDSGCKMDDMLKVKDTYIDVAGNRISLDEKLPLNQWHNLRVVFTKGGSSTAYTVYLTRADGTVNVFTGTDSYTNFNGVAKCIISYNGTTDKIRGAWVDNFSIKSYIGGAAPATVSASDAIELVDNGDGTYTATAIVDNAAYADAALIVATYDGETFANAVVDNTAESASSLCKLSATISVTAGQVVKAMLWDGLTNINPILGAVTE